MGEVEEKIPTEHEEEPEESQENEINEQEIPEAIPESLPPAPTPKKKASKKQLIVEIPVDAPAPAPVLERAVSSNTPAPKARGRPKGAVGAAKRAQPTAPPPTPRAELTPEEHMQQMLLHTRLLQESRRTATRDKYRSWVA